MNVSSFIPTILIASIFLIPACQQSSSWEAEGKSLIQEGQQLRQRHDQFDARVDSLWDATTEVLRIAIPADFPPTDREIFLNARNADHIKMFMSFKSLPQETQTLVNVADSIDQQIAKGIVKLHEEQIAFDQKKIDFLVKVSKEDPAAVQQYAQLFHRQNAPQSE